MTVTLPTVSPWQLGATLYTPALHPDLLAIITGKKYPHLKSVVVCLEDAIAEKERDAAFSALVEVNAKRAHTPTDAPPLVFIRPRNVSMGAELVRALDLTHITGFVLPKFTMDCVREWESVLHDTALLVMPTLETADVFDVTAMTALAKRLDHSALRPHLLALRIGGNDLLSTLSLRRPRDLTLYDGPLGYVVSMLVATFGVRGFALTSPVLEHFDQSHVLANELLRDRAHGLVGKTAIHPSQLDAINAAFNVTVNEYVEAVKIRDANCAVFQSDGSMCEPATHMKWANQIIDRASQGKPKK